MRPTLVALLVVPLLGASIAGCGGGSSPFASRGPSPSPSISVPGLISSSGAVPADYLSRVDATCATTLTELQRRGAPPLAPSDPRKLTGAELRAAAAYLQRGADLQRTAAAAIGRLPAPPTGGPEWSAYRTGIAQFAAGTLTEATTARAGDVPAFLSAAQRLLALRSKVLESGLAVGLGAGTACARLF